MFLHNFRKGQMSRQTVILACLIGLVAAGCGNRSNVIPASEAPPTSDAGSTAGASTSAAGEGSNMGMTRLGGPQNSELLQQLTVYFDYDRSDIRQEFNALLAAHGQYLASNPRMQIRLEGHGDERGSREYNIGLGERRAQAVRRVLLLQGATAEQISTVSYGEERPAAMGSNEEAWALNRRVELVYRQ
jgi:peptidoglycan-associated lipoprotein